MYVNDYVHSYFINMNDVPRKSAYGQWNYFNKLILNTLYVILAIFKNVYYSLNFKDSDTKYFIIFAK